MDLKITPSLKKIIREALHEDVGSGDVTTGAFAWKSKRATAVLIAKGKRGVLAGRSVFSEVFRLVDSRVKIRWVKEDGDLIRGGQTICRLDGQISSLLKGERVALNFLSHLSGVASLTREFVEKVRGTRAQILDTRKTLPLLRVFEKYAVGTGGGVNHRMGLWDEGLIKDNHWKLAGHSVYEIIRAARKFRGKKWTVEIEKRHVKENELQVLLAAKPNVILLDNFRPGELRQAVSLIHGISKQFGRRPLIEASGGVTVKNVRQIAKSGVDRISIGAITHSAPAFDFSLELVD